MVSDGNDPDEMMTRRIVSRRDSLSTIAVGLSGNQPDRVMLPDDLANGRYRICATNVGKELYAEFDVVGQ